MQIGIMRVPVPHRRMPMPMAMGFASRIVHRVSVLVMDGVDVPMLVFHGVVLMFMLMRLGQMKIDADRH